MFKASIYITCDPQLVMQAPYANQRVIAITESGPELSMFPPGLVNMGSVLTPNVETMNAELDQEYDVSDHMYREYLSGSVQDKFIILMLTALYKGTNILLYIPKDEYTEFTFKNVLLSHIYQLYGVVVGTPEVQFGFDPNYFPLILSKMYLYDYITSDEFVMQYPEDIGLFPDVVMKLTMDINPYINSNNPEDFHRYFLEYIKNCHKNNVPLTIPIMRV